MTINLSRRGTMHGFWTPPSPPTIPADFPLPDTLRRTLDAADKAEADTAQAIQAWDQTHALMADPPRPAEDAAEHEAWDHLFAIFPPAVAALEKAQHELKAWLTDHEADAAAWEVTRLEAWHTAEAKAQATRAAADRAAHEVGETWRLTHGYVLDRYDHAERPRSIRTGMDASNPLEVERVEAYWTGLANGGDQTALLPGDTVLANLDAPVKSGRRIVVVP